MADLLELVERLPADPLGGRVRRLELRVLALPVLEPPHQAVEFGVGNLRVVKHIVTVLVVSNLLAQFFHLFFNTLRHGAPRRESVEI